MAVNKTVRVTKAKPRSAPKKAAGLRTAGAKKAAGLRTAGAKKAVVLRTAASRTAKPMTAAALKKAALKKAASPKLTAQQHELLKKVVAHKDAKGYHTDKKPEHRVLETLLKQKVVKKGPKHPETKCFHYQISTIGKKYLESGATPKS